MFFSYSYIKCSLTHILYKFLLLPFINISNQKWFFKYFIYYTGTYKHRKLFIYISSREFSIRELSIWYENSFFAADTSCNRSSDAQMSLHNLVPITDSDASHIHCTLNCICKKDHDILYHGTMYHTPLNNTQFSIDAYNALIASIYLHQYFCILKILAHSVDFNELYRNVTIHCPSFSLVR